jgi:hypothetical protein
MLSTVSLNTLSISKGSKEEKELNKVEPNCFDSMKGASIWEEYKNGNE